MITFIKVKEANAELFSMIHSQAWKQAYRDLIPEAYLEQNTPSYFQEAFRSTFSEKEFFFIYNGQRPAGILILSEPEAMQPIGEIQSLYLLEKYKGKGIGKSALNYAIYYFRKKGGNQVVLWVLEQNKHARGFYESQGFEAVGESRIIFRGLNLTQLKYCIFI